MGSKYILTEVRRKFKHFIQSKQKGWERLTQGLDNLTSPMESTQAVKSQMDIIWTYDNIPGNNYLLIH